MKLYLIETMNSIFYELILFTGGAADETTRVLKPWEGIPMQMVSGPIQPRRGFG